MIDGKSVVLLRRYHLNEDCTTSFALFIGLQETLAGTPDLPKTTKKDGFSAKNHPFAITIKYAGCYPT
jgi:hypothetical protein